MTRPSVLYKYVRPDGIRLLTDRCLKVTPPNQFNDPFEVLPNISALMPPDQLDAFFLQHLEESKEDIYDETARGEIGNSN